LVFHLCFRFKLARTTLAQSVGRIFYSIVHLFYWVLISLSPSLASLVPSFPCPCGLDQAPLTPIHLLPRFALIRVLLQLRRPPIVDILHCRESIYLSPGPGEDARREKSRRPGQTLPHPVSVSSTCICYYIAVLPEGKGSLPIGIIPWSRSRPTTVCAGLWGLLTESHSPIALVPLHSF